MSESNEEIRYILKFYYKKGKNVTQAVKRICDVYVPSAVSVRMHVALVGRPITDKINAIFEKLGQNRHISSYDVAEQLGIDHKTVLAHLKTTWYTKKLDIWVPHELTERNLMNRAGQASQTVAKPGLTRNKVLLCVWWDWKGIIHYELLPPGRTIDSELYSVV
ncbi:hypothetical protein ABMA28_017081 [Loxostege sticticalis]|uniref:Mos1 transposase HTH domain-containing protein n=1 Tax=Loxostege sticticalis TaxID=481309 RepID=A0ABD0T6X5_LOXSC